jgi:hypothetical protein
MRWPLLLTLILSLGCSKKSRYIPGAKIPLASADYVILGSTSAESCGTYVLGLDFKHLFTSQASTYTAGANILWGNAEARRALYEALGRIPDATHLMAPRMSSSFNGVGTTSLPLFGQRCSTVEARGVRVGERPVPNAQ